jgi:hypothetical protein
MVLAKLGSVFGVVALLVAAMVAPTTSKASPILWTLSGVTFDDGSTASGSFVFNADTDQYSSIDVITTAGSTFGAETYLFANACCSNADQLALATSAGSQTGLTLLFLQFFSPLTNAGGTATLGLVFESTCQNMDCSVGDFPILDTSDAGTVTTSVTATPEPSSALLLGTGVLTFMAMAMRRCRA